MSDPVARLAQDRATREAALAVFNADLTQVKNDLEARGIGGRIADQAGHEVRAGFNEAVAIAEDSKGIVAATIAALVLWFLRNPLIDGVCSLLGDQPDDVAANPVQARDQEPVVVSPSKSRHKTPKAGRQTQEPIA